MERHIDREFLTIAEARELLPGRPDVSTLHRWANKGIKGVRLRTTRVGGRRYVLKTEIDSFVAALNSDPGMSPSPHSIRTASNFELDVSLDKELSN